MTGEMLAELAHLERSSSPGPWFVRDLNDASCMSAVGVSMAPADASSTGFAAGAWPEQDLVAACLIQRPDGVAPHDGRHDENALLIARMRNALPELLRLAAIGLATERVS